MRNCVGIIFLVIATLVQCTTQVAGGGDEVSTRTVYGYVYHQNGSPAAACSISVVSSNAVPGNGSTFQSITNAQGMYLLPRLSSGKYNVFGKNDSYSLLSYLKDIQILDTQSAVRFPNDTLKPKGAITGSVRLANNEDCRTVLIMVVGGDIVTWPLNKNGVFYIENLAQGNYSIRFLTTLSYPVLDTTFSVATGKETDVGIITIINHN